MPCLLFPFSIQGSRNQKLPVRHGVIAVPKEIDRDLLQKAPFPGGVALSLLLLRKFAPYPPTRLCCSHTALDSELAPPPLLSAWGISGFPGAWSFPLGGHISTCIW